MITMRLLALMLMLACTVHADTLVLKNGLTLQGTYKGGTEQSIKFETSGKTQEVAVSEVKSITFGNLQAISVPGGVALPATAAGGVSGAAAAAIIPAGTKLMIRTQEAIGTGTHQKGARITATLEKNIEIGRQIAAPKGSIVYGRVIESSSPRRAGLKRILIAFDQLVIDERPVDIQTDDIGLEAANDTTIKTIGSGAMMTAAIGGPDNVSLIGNTGTAATGKQIRIPEKALLVVTLKKEVRLKP